jgi:hypothetical protein
VQEVIDKQKHFSGRMVSVNKPEIPVSHSEKNALI